MRLMQPEGRGLERPAADRTGGRVRAVRRASDLHGGASGVLRTGAQGVGRRTGSARLGGFGAAGTGAATRVCAVAARDGLLV